MMRIEGLNTAQVEMCDILWSFDTVHEVQDYIDELPTKEEKCLAQTMHGMLIAAAIDDEISSYDDCYLARNILDQVRY